MKKKRDFPYDYWDSFEKFKESLPSKDKFYNTLTNHEISLKKLWTCSYGTFKVDTMKDYHDFYLKIDVLLLACVFETFRKESIHWKQNKVWFFYDTLQGIRWS